MSRRKRITAETEAPTPSIPHYRHGLGEIVALWRADGEWLIEAITYYGYKLRRVDDQRGDLIAHIKDEDIKAILDDGRDYEQS